MRQGSRTMNWKLLMKGFQPILGAILFLVLGFFVLWIAKTALNIQQDAVLVSLLLIPAILYLIFSGKLQEFSAGGVSAKFNDAAQKPLSKDATKVEPLEVEDLPKGNLPDLERFLAHFPTTEYVVLKVLLGNAEIRRRYRNEALLKYLQTLSRYPNFKFLVVMDQAKTVFAYISVNRTIRILEAELTSGENRFTAAINEGQRDQLLNYYGLMKPTLFTTDTNLKALEQMTEKNTDALIVIDEDRMLKGVVEREQILSKLMLALRK